MTIDLNNYLSWICKPLFENKVIDSFRYNRMYLDGTCFSLNTNPTAENAILFEYEGKYNFDIAFLHTLFDSINLNYRVSNRICFFSEDIDLTGFWEPLKQLHNITGCFNIVKKTDDYYERYGFLSHSDRSSYSFYINHGDLLDKFIIYFKEYSTKLIAEGIKNKTLWINRNPRYLYLIEEIKNKQAQIDNQLLKLEGQLNLRSNTDITTREMECLKYIGQGFSYKDIGKILCISNRTVETHIQHIKSKLKIFSRSDLLKFSHSLQVIK